MHLQVQVLSVLLSVFEVLEQHSLLSFGVGSTVSTCVGGILLLTSKKCKKKLLKCYELLDNKFFSYL